MKNDLTFEEVAEEVFLQNEKKRYAFFNAFIFISSSRPAYKIRKQLE